MAIVNLVGENDKKVLNNMKALAIDMITEANSGHPGIVLSAAPLVHTLFSRYLIVNPNDPTWLNRDRLVMSAGHGSALLYSAMFMAGYHLKLDDMKQFRKLGSILPGHPEYGVTPGVDVSTGPLGQGIATAAGIAIGELFLENTFLLKEKKQVQTLFDYYTYVICSDGDLMEGVSHEAISLAGTLGLGKLIVLYDANQMTLDGPTGLTFNEDIKKKFEACNWHVQEVKDSTNIGAVDKAIKKARLELNKPSIVIARSIIGKDSVLEGLREAHGTPLTKEQVTILKDKWGMRDVPFAVSKESVQILQKSMVDRNMPLYQDFQKKLALFKENDEFKDLINSYIQGDVTFDMSKCEFKFEIEASEPMREVNCKVLNSFVPQMKLLMAASADVFSSTKAYIKDAGDFTDKNRSGKNLWCGVREHSMAAIANGISLCGIRTFTSTFLAFSDYMKPAMRMSAIMKLPVTYIFTHDSFTIGEDGPTHQPVEQLSVLRATPNLYVYRPADINEIVGCWSQILKTTDHPTALIISKSKVDKLSYGNSKGVEKGAYLVRKETTTLAGIIIATGTEVQDAVDVADELMHRTGLDVRVISMPCVELFNDQPAEYRKALLPDGYKVIAIEAGAGLAWYPFVSNPSYVISFDRFGNCGTCDELKKAYGFDQESLINKIESLLK